VDGVVYLWKIGAVVLSSEFSQILVYHCCSLAYGRMNVSRLGSTLCEVGAGEYRNLKVTESI